MEEDRRILFQCTVINDEITETMCSGLGIDDMKRIITSILAICRESPNFHHMLHLMIHMMEQDPEFTSALDEATVDCPDFNKLLDNNKSNSSSNDNDK